MRNLRFSNLQNNSHETSKFTSSRYSLDPTYANRFSQMTIYTDPTEQSSNNTNSVAQNSNPGYLDMTRNDSNDQIEELHLNYETIILHMH